MARLKFRTDGTIALFDPSDDPFPPFPDEALLHFHRHCRRRPQIRHNLSYRQRYRRLKRSRTFQQSKARLRLPHRHSHCKRYQR
jgi:hypothetical protein